MAKQDTVATLLRDLVLQEAPMTAQRSLRLRQRPGHSLADILPVTAGRSVHTVTRLDDFVAQALNHTDHLPPVLCTREDMRGYYPAGDATQSEMGAFRAHVFGPVRLAAAVLGHLGHVRVSQAMLNAGDEDGTGHLLYCDAAAADKADSEPRMIVLGLSPRHFTSDDLRAFAAQGEVPALSQKAAPSTRVWHHVADLCQRNNVRYFAISTYDEWILGCFTDGYASAAISPSIPYTGTRPTVVECLCYWIERARRDSDGVVSTGSNTITAPKQQQRVRFAQDDRDEPENMQPQAPPRTPRKRRAAATVDDHSPARRRAEESSPTRSSPRKRRVAEDNALPVGSPEKKQRREREREREALMQLNADVEMSSARAADILEAAAPAARALSPVKMLLSEEEHRGPVDVQEGVVGHRRYQRSAAAARMAFRGS